MNKSPIRIITVFTLVLMMVASSVIVAEAAGISKPPYIGYKWIDNPTVMYGATATGHFRNGTINAIDNVNSVLKNAGSSIKLKKSTTNRTAGKVQPGEIAIQSYNYSETGWVGLTSYKLKRPQVTWVIESNTIKINNFYWQSGNRRCMATDNGWPNHNATRGTQSVVAHELCHALGFDHPKATLVNQSSILYPTVETYVRNGVYLVDVATQSAIKNYYK
ncbi:MAG: hypothetical protein LBN34_02410 [Clostridiales Family XIII bacterium]|jgi:hypothetical protein|nr:hypothetical protein [Clostridiales Family XIII bacterium]